MNLIFILTNYRWVKFQGRDKTATKTSMVPR